MQMTYLFSGLNESGTEELRLFGDIRGNILSGIQRWLRVIRRESHWRIVLLERSGDMTE
jgi:hypothetical protein